MWQDDEDFDLVQKAYTFLSERRYPDGCSYQILERQSLSQTPLCTHYPIALLSEWQSHAGFR